MFCAHCLSQFDGCRAVMNQLNILDGAEEMEDLIQARQRQNGIIL